ncbi:MAG TPA: ABC transporter permease [Candidatus Acidoferrales bacterium]|nr:ABC transporter permease [Candidatus Acidoferrales bacterium]
MRTLRRFLRRLSSWATTRQDEERLRAEIEEHLALQTAENARAGLSPVEARRQAVLKFGGVEAMKESYRDQRGLPFLETLIQDTRHALRRLRMAPAFTIATVLTLALGIGATTSIFTLVHAVLLKSLPVANPGELYRLGRETHCCYTAGYSQDKEFSLVSYDLYKYLRDNTKGFSELAAVPSIEHLFGVRRSGSSEAAQSYPGEFVSGNYFTMFGITAYAGRAFTAKDDQSGAPPVAVMSYRLWQQKYGADPSVIGGVFNLNDKPFTVVGITPPGFFGDTLRSTPPDFFLPLNTEPFVESDADLNKYDTHWLDLIGRIQPGAAPASIEAEMRVELKQWLRSHWGEMSANDRAKFPEQTLFLSPGGAGVTSMREQYQHWLQILMTVTAFVLLIVCANVANLMLVRGMERRRQTSLSMALGARASRVVGEHLIESILLSLFGGAAGLAIAFAGTRLILHFAFPASAGLAGVPIGASPSVPVLLFAFAISLTTGIAFGIAPAWMATRVDPIEALRGASRSTARTGSLPRKTLVVFQAALSLVLLSAAGLLTAALQSLENQNFGFEQDRRLVASMNPRVAGYRSPQLSPLYRSIHDSIAGIPGVSSVALCLYAPLSGGGWGAGVWVDGHPAPGPRDENFAAWDRVTEGYFDVIGTPIVNGRGISGQDTAASRSVAVINEAFARRFFRNEDPIGKHFGRRPEASREFEVIGVAKDARYLTHNLDRPSDPFFFLPEAQAEYTQKNLGSLFLHDIVIVTRPGASLSIPAIRQAMASVDPNLPLISIRPLREQVAEPFTQQRLIARLTSFFGVLSLVLASIGLYGVTAYNAGRRVSEIGVRMALGANRGDVIRLVLRGAFGLILCGLFIGLPLTFAAGRFLGNQLYGMNPYNPAVTLAAVVTLGLSALAASLIPALRASLISPLEALREE